MKTVTLQLIFTSLFFVFFSLSGNAQCSPEIAGYTNIGLYNDHNYYISTSNARPTDAQAAAEALGGYLTVINDADENDFLQTYIDELTYIGFNDANTEGTIETVNGEPVTYTNIDPCSFCQSNDANNDFVVMEPWGNGGEWSFSNFFNQRKYIVEIPCGTSNNSNECSFLNEISAQNFPGSSSSGSTRVLENANDYEFRSESVLFGPERRLVRWKFDKLGNEISITDISSPYPTGMDFGRISTLGDYFFMHDVVGLNPQLNKYDFSGNPIFSETYVVNTTISNISYTVSRDAWEDEDGILITGHSGDGPDGLRQPFLIKTDLDGNEEWQVLLPTENKFVGLNVQGRSSDGGYYLILSVGTSTPDKIIKIDAVGNILWTHETPLNSSNSERDHLGETPDGSAYYYVQNDVGASSSIGYWGFKLNAATGAVIWEQEIGEIFSLSPSTYEFINRGAAISNDGGLFVDFGYFLNNTYIGDKYGKLDSNGNLVWGYDKPLHFSRVASRLGTSDGGLLMFGVIGNDFNKRFLLKITSDGSYAPICEGGNNSATLDVNCDFGFTGSSPNNPFVYIDPAQNPNGEVIQWDTPTGTTTCPGGIVTVELINGLPSGSTFTVGNFDVLYKVSDACGNEKFCNLELRVRGPGPIINCTDDITVNATNAAGAVVNYDLPTTMMPPGGTCGYGPFDLISGLNTASGSQFPIGTTEVEYIAFRTGSPSLCEHLPDNFICSFNVTVEDSGTGGCPQNISGFTTIGEFGDSKYYISNSFSRPVDAQAVAESFGGYLVSINSQAENDFIQQYADGLTYIGLTDQNTEGSLEWFNGDAVTYNNVDPCGFCNENSSSQDYGVIQPWDGGWSFSNFFNSRKYIMEIPCSGSNDLPDLTLSNFTNLPSSGETGDVISFNINLNNIGTATATGSYNINFYISSNNSFSSNDAFAGQIPTGDTPVGTITGVPAAITVPNLPDGNYFLLGVADINNTINESDENNNTIAVSFEIGSSGGGCPTSLSGFTSLGEFNGSAYFLSNDVSRPTDAQNVAAANGGNLVIINSQAENDFLYPQINSLVYIGINDAATEGTPAWVDGSSVGFTNFDICSFCNENESSKDYVIMHGWNGGWSWSSVWNQRKYIVEIPCTAPINSPNANNTLIAFPTDEIEKLTLDKLLPNPANDFIHASIFSSRPIGEKNEIEIQIIDARGVLVKSERVGIHKGSNTIELNINELPSGFYMIYIPDAQQKHKMQRFIKSRD